jgi:E3 ubiquitin-protein ligase RNF144
MKEESYQQALKHYTCTICLESLSEYDPSPLSMCEHVFHKECIVGYIKNEVAENKYPVKCPQNDCNKVVDEVDVKDFLGFENIEVVNKFRQFSLKHALESQKDISWCPTADCTYAFVFEEGDWDYHCRLCKKRYCLNCKCDFHVGLTCAEYKEKKSKEEDDVFFKFAAGMKFKMCPNCRVWVERTAGCNSMRCKCGINFCYNCGRNAGN